MNFLYPYNRPFHNSNCPSCGRCLNCGGGPWSPPPSVLSYEPYTAIAQAHVELAEPAGSPRPATPNDLYGDAMWPPAKPTTED